MTKGKRVRFYFDQRCVSSENPNVSTINRSERIKLFFPEKDLTLIFKPRKKLKKFTREELQEFADELILCGKTVRKGAEAYFLHNDFDFDE